ncbi:hypothetical protein AB0B83_17760 [Micromonospora sp. NPDC049060]|uniref:hypothetical protein n=1 Tax=Micromonospora sp. NPDC049060 TaxID=3154828 RepID=UPI0033DAA963
MKFKTFAFTVALLLAGMVVAAPARASTKSLAAPPAECTYYLYADDYGDSCFQPNGDKIWVADNSENGWSPEVKLEASYPAEGNRYKTRYCAHDPNFPLGEGGWDSCNFDHRETHCVRWWIYERSINSPGLTRFTKGPTPWIGVDDGKPGNCTIE